MRELGWRAIDRRTLVGRALAAWRVELIDELADDRAGANKRRIEGLKEDGYWARASLLRAWRPSSRRCRVVTPPVADLTITPVAAAIMSPLFPPT